MTVDASDRRELGVDYILSLRSSELIRNVYDYKLKFEFELVLWLSYIRNSCTVVTVTVWVGVWTIGVRPWSYGRVMFCMTYTVSFIIYSKIRTQKIPTPYGVENSAKN